MSSIHIFGSFQSFLKKCILFYVLEYDFMSYSLHIYLFQNFLECMIVVVV